MRLFRRFRSTAEDAGQADATVHGAALPQAVINSIPRDQRGGPYEELEDGRFIIVGRNAIMVSDSREIIDSGFWHEIQYASWDADTRNFRLVWTQPDREPVVGLTVTDNPKDLMEKITLRVDSTIVATRRFVTSTGVPVAATVRRRVDGELFSAVIAAGPISDADEEKAYLYESQLREELGMD